MNPSDLVIPRIDTFFIAAVQQKKSYSGQVYATGKTIKPRYIFSKYLSESLYASVSETDPHEFMWINLHKVMSSLQPYDDQEIATYVWVMSSYAQNLGKKIIVINGTITFTNEVSTENPTTYNSKWLGDRAKFIYNSLVSYGSKNKADGLPMIDFFIGRWTTQMFDIKSRGQTLDLGSNYVPGTAYVSYKYYDTAEILKGGLSADMRYVGSFEIFVDDKANGMYSNVGPFRLSSDAVDKREFRKRIPIPGASFGSGGGTDPIPPVENPPDKSNTWVYILIFGLVALVLIVGVIIGLSSKKKANDGPIIESYYTAKPVNSN